MDRTLKGENWSSRELLGERTVLPYFLGPHFQKFLAQNRLFKPAFLFYCFPLSQTLRYVTSASQGLLTMYFKGWIWILCLLHILHTAVWRNNELWTAETVDLLDVFFQFMSPLLTYCLLGDWRKARWDNRIRRSSWELSWNLSALESIPRKGILIIYLPPTAVSSIIFINMGKRLYLSLHKSRLDAESPSGLREKEWQQNSKIVHYIYLGDFYYQCHHANIALGQRFCGADEAEITADFKQPRFDL